MKREWRRERTLQRLLDATGQLIREKGCVQTTFTDIMERSGLSKGAIFHYVKGKDDLLGLVLRSGMEETNRRFYEAIERGRNDFQGPMNEIAAGLPELSAPDDAGNIIFRYLLGRSEEPGVAEVLAEFYRNSVGQSAEWISVGQRYGVIPQSVDAGKTAELFVLIAFGLRMRSGVAGEPFALSAEDVARFMRRTLQPGSGET